MMGGQDLLNHCIQMPFARTLFKTAAGLQNSLSKSGQAVTVGTKFWRGIFRRTTHDERAVKKPRKHIVVDSVDANENTSTSGKYWREYVFGFADYLAAISVIRAIFRPMRKSAIGKRKRRTVPAFMVMQSGRPVQGGGIAPRRTSLASSSSS
jgi:hypothetical protein